MPFYHIFGRISKFPFNSSLAEWSVDHIFNSCNWHLSKTNLYDVHWFGFVCLNWSVYDLNYGGFYVIFCLFGFIGLCFARVSAFWDLQTTERQKKAETSKKHAIKVFEQRTKSSAKEWHVMNIDNA